VFSLALSLAIGVTLCSRPDVPLLLYRARRPARGLRAEPTELKQKGWDFWTIEIDTSHAHSKRGAPRACARYAVTVSNGHSGGPLARRGKGIGREVAADIDTGRKEIAGQSTSRMGGHHCGGRAEEKGLPGTGSGADLNRT